VTLGSTLAEALATFAACREDALVGCFDVQRHVDEGSHDGEMWGSKYLRPVIVSEGG
jgi:hypothetical protein